jgi:hypothetical protein
MILKNHTYMKIGWIPGGWELAKNGKILSRRRVPRWEGIGRLLEGKYRAALLLAGIIPQNSEGY